MAFDKNNTSLFMKIVIIIFAVILVLSLCLPFFSSCSATPSTTQDDSAQSDSSSEASTVAEIQAQYASLIESLEGKLADDPDNLTHLASLGNNYMDEGVDMKSASDAADNEETIAEVFSKAVGYYDDYLEAAAAGDADADSVSAVTVDRAVCLFYSGEEDQAIADLSSFLEATDDYVMGWYNLGAFYSQQGDNDQAKEAFNKVIELDPDNESGIVSYAQLQLAIIEASEEAAEEETDDADGAEEESADEGAADTQTDGADDADATADDGDAAGDADADADADADEADAETDGADATAADADESASTEAE